MRCNHCGSKMTMLFYTQVCDICDPPNNGGVAKEKTFRGYFMYPARETISANGIIVSLFPSMEAAKKSRLVKIYKDFGVPVKYWMAESSKEMQYLSENSPTQSGISRVYPKDSEYGTIKIVCEVVNI